MLCEYLRWAEQTRVSSACQTQQWFRTGTFVQAIILLHAALSTSREKYSAQFQQRRNGAAGSIEHPNPSIGSLSGTDSARVHVTWQPTKSPLLIEMSVPYENRTHTSTDCQSTPTHQEERYALIEQINIVFLAKSNILSVPLMSNNVNILSSAPSAAQLRVMFDANTSEIRGAMLCLYWAHSFRVKRSRVGCAVAYLLLSHGVSSGYEHMQSSEIHLRITDRIHRLKWFSHT